MIAVSTSNTTCYNQQVSLVETVSIKMKKKKETNKKEKDSGLVLRFYIILNCASLFLPVRDPTRSFVFIAVQMITMRLVDYYSPSYWTPVYGFNMNIIAQYICLHGSAKYLITSCIMNIITTTWRVHQILPQSSTLI